MLEKAKEIFESNKDIKYGWIDKKNIYHFHINEGFTRVFAFQSIEQLEKSRVGICWETAELSRYYLNKYDVPCKVYFFVIPSINFYCHSVVVFKDNEKYYWLENSFKNLKGIHEFNSLEELFCFVLKNFHLLVNKKNININLMKIYEYDKPKDGLTCIPFYFHCFRSKNITSLYLKNCLNLIENNSQ